MDVVERGVGSIIRFALYLFWGPVSVSSMDIECGRDSCKGHWGYLAN